jgi:hypothetical protein
MSILFLYDGESGLIGAAGKISTNAAGFDPDYDVSAVRVLTNRFTPAPFSATWAVPSGDLWLGFRYRAPSTSTGGLAADGVFLEFRDAANAIVARMKTERDDATYRAQAFGDTTVEGASAFTAADATDLPLFSGPLAS